MQNFFSSILKNKKALVFALLFLVVFGLILPRISFGQVPIFPGTNIATESTPPAESTDADKCKSSLSWYKSIVAGIADILVLAPKEIAYWAAILSSIVISNVIDWPITNGSTGDPAVAAFISGWMSVKDLANMIIVLGFVIIGIATTLRIQDYQAKKLLLPLILIALLINFSNVFVGLFIDASNIMMKSLTTGTSTMGIKFMTDIQQVETGLACKALAEGNLSKYVTTDVLFGLIYLAVGISFFYLAVMLIARYAILGILFILSPLAFVSWVFPASKKIWTQWWDNFIKWVFVGVGICFFLNIAGKILGTFKNLSDTDVTAAGIFFVLSIVLITLVVGIKISTKSSAMGAAAVMGLAGGAVGLAMGVAGKAGMGTLKGLGRMTDKASGGRISGAGRSISSGVGRAMEAIGVRKTGTTATANAKRVEEETKLMANEYAAAKASGDAGTVSRIQGWARNGKGARGAAAMKVVADAKDLHKVFKDPSDPTGKKMDLAAAAARLSYADSVGAKDIIKDTENSIPGLARYNNVTVKELEGTINPATGKNYTTAAAKREAVRRKHAGMSISKIRDLPESQFTVEAIEDWDKKTLARAGLEFSPEQRTSAKKLVPALQSKVDFELGLMPGATPADRKAAFKAASGDTQKKVRELVDKGNIIKGLT